MENPTADITSKLKTDCAELAKNSYKCLEENAGNSSKCQDHFTIYKACRKAEHTRIIDERRKMYS